MSTYASYIQFTLRLPVGLHKKLRKLAKADGRSMQVWIQRALEQVIEATPGPERPTEEAENVSVIREG